jgi:hypothetical protein
MVVACKPDGTLLLYMFDALSESFMFTSSLSLGSSYNPSSVVAAGLTGARVWRSEVGFGFSSARQQMLADPGNVQRLMAYLHLVARSVCLLALQASKPVARLRVRPRTACNLTARQLIVSNERKQAY